MCKIICYCLICYCFYSLYTDLYGGQTRYNKLTLERDQLHTYKLIFLKNMYLIFFLKISVNSLFG